jgi:hypothetical protein
MAVKRCEHARDKIASKGKAAGLNDLEALMSEEALREIMEGDDSFENLFSNSGSGNGGKRGNHSSSNGGLLATLGEGDEEDDDDEGVAGTGRLRWGSNEVGASITLIIAVLKLKMKGAILLNESLFVFAP